jgi:phage recombination protein Bet
MNAVTQTEGTSLIVSMAGKYNMDPAKFQQTIKATCLPPKVSIEEFAAFVMIAKEYDLNPILREVFAYAKPGGGLQVVVSVDGWAKLINRQPTCDGIEFDDHPDDQGGLASITCKIYRKDRSRPTTATEYMVECKQASSVWQKWPRRMLRHKALIQCARYAFGFAGIIDQDEAERYIPAARQEVASPPAPLPSAPLEAPVPPEPPAPPSPKEAITVIDGDVVVDAVQEPDEREPYDINQYFDELDASLGAETTVAGIEERWTEYDPIGETAGNPTDTNIVEAIKARHLRRVGKV